MGAKAIVTVEDYWREWEYSPVNTVVDLIDAIDRMPAGDAWRGQANIGYGLTSSIFRKAKQQGANSQNIDKEIAKLEQLHDDRMQERLPWTRGLTPIDRAMLMQHYGAKTRLMDVTGSPWVALFFASFSASAKRSKLDGLLLQFRWGGSHRSKRIVSRADMLASPGNSMEDWAKTLPSNYQYSLPRLVWPQPLDARMGAQRGGFIITSPATSQSLNQTSLRKSRTKSLTLAQHWDWLSAGMRPNQSNVADSLRVLVVPGHLRAGIRVLLGLIHPEATPSEARTAWASKAPLIPGVGIDSTSVYPDMVGSVQWLDHE